MATRRASEIIGLILCWVPVAALGVIYFPWSCSVSPTIGAGPPTFWTAHWGPYVSVLALVLAVVLPGRRGGMLWLGAAATVLQICLLYVLVTFAWRLVGAMLLVSSFVAGAPWACSLFVWCATGGTAWLEPEVLMSAWFPG